MEAGQKVNRTLRKKKGKRKKGKGPKRCRKSQMKGEDWGGVDVSGAETGFFWKKREGVEKPKGSKPRNQHTLQNLITQFKDVGRSVTTEGGQLGKENVFLLKGMLRGKEGGQEKGNHGERSKKV